MSEHNTRSKMFDPAITSGAGQGTITGAGTYTSLVSSPKNHRIVSYDVTITGTLAGTLTVKWGNPDGRGAVNTFGTYTPIAAITSWTPGTPFGIAITDYEFGQICLEFVVSSGSGTITAKYAAKE